MSVKPLTVSVDSVLPQIGLDIVNEPRLGQTLQPPGPVNPTTATDVQPLLPLVTVTLYDPTVNPETLAVVAPVLHI